MLAEYLERFGDRPEIRGPLETILKEAKTNMSPDTLPDSVRQAYLDLNKALGLASGGGLSAPPDADREPFDPEDAYQAGNEEGANFGDFNPFSGILGVLRQLSYFKMKNRARTVGEVGMHQFLKDLQTATAGKGTRIHLMGHSFGTIVISGMLGGPNGRGPLVRPVDSVVLAQGALSLWSLCARYSVQEGRSGILQPDRARSEFQPTAGGRSAISRMKRLRRCLGKEPSPG
jgi:hypothetical protein